MFFDEQLVVSSVKIRYKNQGRLFQILRGFVTEVLLSLAEEQLFHPLFLVGVFLENLEEPSLDEIRRCCSTIRRETLVCEGGFQSK